MAHESLVNYHFIARLLLQNVVLGARTQYNILKQLKHKTQNHSIGLYYYYYYHYYYNLLEFETESVHLVSGDGQSLGQT